MLRILFQRVSSGFNPGNPQSTCLIGKYPKSFFQNVKFSISTKTNPSDSVRVLRHIGSQTEIEQYLKLYSGVDKTRFAVINVGGSSLMKELDILASSLSNLYDIGLYPIVVHGAKPQLDLALEQAGIESLEVEGLRSTSAETLYHARKVFLQENLRLVKALQDRGVRARPVTSGVFDVDYVNKEKLQYVGKVVDVDVTAIKHSIECGEMPIIPSMGATKSGQILNVNSVSASQFIAKVLEPTKIMLLRPIGGIQDKDGKIIHNINLDTDYSELISKGTHLTKRDVHSLGEIKKLLAVLPRSSVAITNALNMTKELFTHSGNGTLVKKNPQVEIYDNLEDVDTAKLRDMIEYSFGAELIPNYYDSVKSKIHRIYIVENYRAVAILTKEHPNDTTCYVDKFAVSGNSEHIHDILWQNITKENPKLVWRASLSNPRLSWYLNLSDGSYSNPNWIVFWNGFEEMDIPKELVQKAFDKPATILYTQPIPVARDGHSVNSPKMMRSFHTSSNSSSPLSSSLISSSLRPRNHHISNHIIPGRRSFSSQSKAKRIALIGARGHTGNELIRLISDHDDLDLVIVSSREYRGLKLGDVIDCRFRNLTFVTITPEEIPHLAKMEIDVWIMALPNGISRPFVDAIDKLPGTPKIVDLSADYRFDDNWVYGLPERHGAREKLSTATRVANPGCYATGSQLSLFPLTEAIDVAHSPNIFGVSGYSGAGTSPSRKNDVSVLADNLLPYTLVGHMHEKEISSQLQNAYPKGIQFMPHVASWFRGIALTVSLQLAKKYNRDEIIELFRDYYKEEPLVTISEHIPEVKSLANKHGVTIGGFAVDETNNHLVLTTCLDNLLKGAATQCIQNINLMLGFPEFTAITTE